MASHVVILTDYEVANLREAIQACGYPWQSRPSEPNPLKVLNSGDWLGQVYWKLPNVDYFPNQTAEAYAVVARRIVA